MRFGNADVNTSGFWGGQRKKGGKKWVTIDESKGVGLQGKVS